MKIPTTTAVTALLAALLPFAPVSCLEAPPVLGHEPEPVECFEQCMEDEDVRLQVECLLIRRDPTYCNPLIQSPPLHQGQFIRYDDGTELHRWYRCGVLGDPDGICAPPEGTRPGIRARLLIRTVINSRRAYPASGRRRWSAIAPAGELVVVWKDAEGNRRETFLHLGPPVDNRMWSGQSGWYGTTTTEWWGITLPDDLKANLPGSIPYAHIQVEWRGPSRIHDEDWFTIQAQWWLDDAEHTDADHDEWPPTLEVPTARGLDGAEVGVP